MKRLITIAFAVCIFAGCEYDQYSYIAGFYEIKAANVAGADSMYTNCGSMRFYFNTEDKGALNNMDVDINYNSAVFPQGHTEGHWWRDTADRGIIEFNNTKIYFQYANRPAAYTWTFYHTLEDIENHTPAEFLDVERKKTF